MRVVEDVFGEVGYGEGMINVDGRSLGLEPACCQPQGLGLGASSRRDRSRDAV